MRSLALVAYWPTLLGRLFEGDGEMLALSGRGELWSFYWQEFLFSSLFGRGFGAGFLAGGDWFDFALPTPTQRVPASPGDRRRGRFALIVGAIVLWYRQLLHVASPNDREFLLALAPALAAYALTDNILVYSGALALYAYLAVILIHPTLLAMHLPLAEADRQPELAEL